MRINIQPQTILFTHFRTEGVYEVNLATKEVFLIKQKKNGPETRTLLPQHPAFLHIHKIAQALRAAYQETTEDSAPSTPDNVISIEEWKNKK